MKKILAILIATLVLTTQVLADITENKKTTIAFYQAIYSGEDTSQFIGDGYVEHQLGTGFTLDGLRQLATQSEGVVTVHRVIAQDGLVFLHVEQQNGEDSIARGELFRLDDNGLVVEHWGNQQIAVPASKTKSGNSMFDGVTEVNPGSQTAIKYGPAHLKAMDVFWNTLDTSIIPGALTDAYIQHNPGGVNGPKGILGLADFLRSKGITLEKVLHQSVSEGDFIVKLNFYRSTPPVPGFGQAFAFDIIRLAKDGRADEHWDIIENIENIGDLKNLY